MRMVLLLSEQHGFGSDTYDFNHVCVIADGMYIEHRLPGGRLMFWLLSLFYKSGHVDYGFSYEARDRMFSDLAGRRISRIRNDT